MKLTGGICVFTLGHHKWTARRAGAGTLFHVGSEDPVFVRQGTLTVCTLAELHMIIHNVVGHGIIASEHITQVTIHFTFAALDNVARVWEGPLLGGRGLERGN